MTARHRVLTRAGASLLLALAAPAAFAQEGAERQADEQASQAPAAAAPEARSALLVPADWALPGDDRGAGLSSRRFLLACVRTEQEVLARERAGSRITLADGAEGAAKNGGAPLSVDLGRLAAALAGSPDPATYARSHLAFLDRHVYLFAQERLLADGYDVAAFSAWRAANVQFLLTGEQEHRAAAVVRRDQALKSFEKGIVLTGALEELAKGPLSEAGRKQLLGVLNRYYPKENFGSVGLIAGAAPAGAAAGGAPRAAGAPDPSLPRLDGVEHPMRAIESLNRLDAGGG